ncbi:hypothetical protein ACHAP5_008485 [Fusarium lateritium]
MFYFPPRLTWSLLSILCHECAFASATGAQLAVRQATVHRGERDFVYPECGEAFGQSSTRDTHVQAIHAEAAARPCDVCGEITANSREMVDHKNRMHSGAREKYACKICGYRTARPASLTVHMAVHSETMDFVCHHTGCEKAYKNKGSLARHLTKAH